MYAVKMIFKCKWADYNIVQHDFSFPGWSHWYKIGTYIIKYYFLLHLVSHCLLHRTLKDRKLLSPWQINSKNSQNDSFPNESINWQANFFVPFPNIWSFQNLHKNNGWLIPIWQLLFFFFKLNLRFLYALLYRPTREMSSKNSSKMT